MSGGAEAGARLLFVSASAYRLGGLSTWLDYLLPGLRDRGWDPVLGLLEGPRHHRPGPYLEEHPHDQWVAIPCATGTPEGRRRAIAGTIDEVDPDLVVGVNAPDAYAAVARLRARGSKVRTMMTIHGILPQLVDDARRFRGVLDGVTGTNRLASALAVRLGGVEPERVGYAPYGIALPPAPPAAVPPTDRLRIGYVGRLDQDQKRVLDLPRISAALDRRGVPHEWRIAGTGPEEAALRRALEDREACFLGHVPHDRVPAAVHRRVDVLLVPSSWETGPLVAWEAMREGVPVVISRYVGSGLEGALIHDENALRFPIGDAEAAAVELERLDADAGLRATLREGGMRLLRERYSREASIEGWERCFRETLEAPPRRPGPAPEVPRADGRLGRWLPAGTAEAVRRALGRTGPDSGPGGEWPHSYGEREDLGTFLARAAEIDRGDLEDADLDPARARGR